jgi:hypothetical protein
MNRLRMVIGTALDHRDCIAQHSRKLAWREFRRIDMVNCKLTAVHIGMQVHAKRCIITGEQRPEPFIEQIKGTRSPCSSADKAVRIDNVVLPIPDGPTTNVLAPGTSPPPSNPPSPDDPVEAQRFPTASASRTSCRKRRATASGDQPRASRSWWFRRTLSLEDAGWIARNPDPDRHH